MMNNYLNGIVEGAQSAIQESTHFSFWDQLPTKPDEEVIRKKEEHIKAMHKRYKLYYEKNQLMAIIAQLNSLLNAKEDEIERIV